MLIYQALLDTVEQLPDTVQAGVLIDEQYGASIAELASRTGGEINLAMPIEAGSRASPSAAASGGIPCTPGCTTAAPPGRLAAASPARTSTSPGITSTPGKANSGPGPTPNSGSGC
jgi:hypothetical protein